MKKHVKIKKGIQLWNKAKKIIPGGTQLLSKRSEMFLPDQWPSYFKKAKGVEVWDLDGNRFIDMAYMGIGSCILGYADSDVNKAVKKVIDESSMCTLNSPEEVELAEILLKLHPWAGQVRYARSGGEAMAIAVRIARAFTQKEKVAFCYDDKTEILTKDGFKDFKDLTDNEVVATLNPDTGFLEYHAIEKKVEYYYAGKMIHFKGQRVDLIVTPDHKIYRKFRLKNGYHFKSIEASNALKRKVMTQMTSSCRWQGEKISEFSIPKIAGQTRPTKDICSFMANDFVRFMGWYLSEGFCINRKGRYEIGVAQDEKNAQNSEEIFSIIKKLGFTPYRNSHHICFSSKELTQYLSQFGKCKEKYIPNWIKNLSLNLLELFVDSIIKGDGTFEKGRWRKFYSTSKKLIDGMQEILLKLGYSTTVKEYNGNGFSKGKIYHLNIGKEKIIGSWPKEEDYNGYVYCVTVPNHIILVRRNGKIVWSGNCGYHGWHDWYLAANLADKKNLDGQLLPGLEPLGVPRCLKGTAIPFNYNKIDELEKIVKENDIGVIAMEPRREHEPEKNFLENIRKIANKIGAVLIFDEITSGFRMNTGGIHMLYGVYPDITVLAKAMSNGYPIAAVIGKREIMDVAQKTFISSTTWTERTGPAAAIATIKKLKKHDVPKHLCKMGNLIKDGWESLAKKHNLKIEVFSIPSLITFKLPYGKDSQALHTLFNQEMLKRGFLTTKSVYVSFSHKEKHIKKYLENVDEVFGLISKAIKNKNIYDLLEGPVAHEGFRRLT